MRSHIIRTTHTVDVTVPAGVIRVRTAPAGATQATVTLSPHREGDEVAAEVIAGASITEAEGRVTVVVPTPPQQHGTTHVAHVDGFSSSTSVTIINGQVVMGGTVIAGGGNLVGGRSGGAVVAEVVVPAGTTATLSGTATRIVTTGPLDTVEATSTSGDVRIDTAQRVRARSTSGDVTVARARQVEATSTSGDVRLDWVSESGTARSMSGDIRVTTATSDVTANTMSGDVRVSQVDGAELPRHAVSSMSGRVILR